MKLPLRLLPLLAALALSGCFKSGQTIPVNLDFSHTNYGFINSGDYKAGSLFLWDQGQDSLSYLGDVPGFDAPEHPRDKASDAASYSGGVDLGGEFGNPAIKLRADALIRSRSSFEIAYPNRVAYNRVYTRLSNYLTPDIKDGGALMDEWGFAEAVNDPQQYYVLIRDVTYGDGITLLVDGEAKAGGGFRVPLKGLDVEIELQGRGLQAIKGDNTEVAFAVYVLRPYWKDSDGGQNPAFRVRRGLDISGLPALFRKVGQSS